MSSEPNGWTVVGQETNFIAKAGESEKSGTLLGQPVTVHFTPVAYAWRYGDGSGKTTTTPGARWEASGLSNFAKTATSHAYAARGTYAVTVTVAYSARYRYAGQGWVSIAGTLGLTSDPITIQVKGVKTVLVGKTCTENPSGPGC
ncbi:PKD domain-containing protein [Gryllotalpicola daejeonensis]|uniref:PKD domain-containing protein n=1 Tax=Gryllotalpicola daejeonensis TaxID=993087 RepID=UPI0031E1B88F